MQRDGGFLLTKGVCVGALLLTLSACGRAAPDAGEAAVLVRKPWFFGHGGVVQEPVTTGLVFIAMSTSVKYVNLNPQAFSIQFDDMMSQDGIPLSFDATLTVQVIDPVSLVQNFSGGGATNGTENTTWYANNIQPTLVNLVRDAFKTHDMNSLAITADGAIAVEADVKSKLIAYIAANHIPVKVVNFVLGRVNPPQGIKQQRTLTAEETQRKQTEIQTQQAEENRKLAETARASADDAYRQAMGLSPEQFVELQRIKMIHDVCAQKGSTCTFISGNGMPVINTGK